MLNNLHMIGGEGEKGICDANQFKKIKSNNENTQMDQIEKKDMLCNKILKVIIDAFITKCAKHFLFELHNFKYDHTKKPKF